MIRIIVADDHTLIREALVKMLNETREVDVVGEAGNGKRAVELTERLKPDVLLLDIHMPMMDGLEVLAALGRSNSATKALILTMHEDDASGVLALRAGAAGFLRKSSSMSTILEAIKKVNRGERVFPGEVVLASKRKRANIAARILSAREFQVMSYLATGKTIKEVAATLSITAKVASSHRASLLKKLHLRTNADIVRYAISNGLIPV